MSRIHWVYFISQEINFLKKNSTGLAHPVDGCFAVTPNTFAPQMSEVQDKVKRLEAEVAELRLMVLERDKIILELKRDKLSGKERRNCDAGTTWAVVCADVYLSHWCEMRLMPYVELVRMSMLCRTMQKRVVDSLRLLRRLDFRFVR